jgi:hypothetical protein
MTENRLSQYIYNCRKASSNLEGLSETESMARAVSYMKDQGRQYRCE